MHTTPHSRPGFTLIELIVVMGVIAVIASTVFVAVDPARRIHVASNNSRRTDVRAILESIKTYQADFGDFPTSADAIDNDNATVQMLGLGGTACAAVTCGSQTFPATACFASGLGTDLVRYLKKIPQDPTTGSPANAKYYVNKDANGFVVVGSCDPQGEAFGGGGTAPVIEYSR